MALNTRAKRASAGHVKRWPIGVTPNAVKPEIWQASVGRNYGGNSFTPVPPGGPGGDVDKTILGGMGGIGGRNEPRLGV